MRFWSPFAKSAAEEVRLDGRADQLCFVSAFSRNADTSEKDSEWREAARRGVGTETSVPPHQVIGRGARRAESSRIATGGRDAPTMYKSASHMSEFARRSVLSA